MERFQVQLGLLQDPAIFFAQNGGPYNPPNQQPTTYTKICAGTSTTDRDHMRAEKMEDVQNCDTTSTTSALE